MAKVKPPHIIGGACIALFFIGGIILFIFAGINGPKKIVENQVVTGPSATVFAPEKDYPDSVYIAVGLFGHFYLYQVVDLNLVYVRVDIITVALELMGIGCYM